MASLCPSSTKRLWEASASLCHACPTENHREGCKWQFNHSQEGKKSCAKCKSKLNIMLLFEWPQVIFNKQHSLKHWCKSAKSGFAHEQISVWPVWQRMWPGVAKMCWLWQNQLELKCWGVFDGSAIAWKLLWSSEHQSQWWWLHDLCCFQGAFFWAMQPLHHPLSCHQGHEQFTFSVFLWQIL